MLDIITFGSATWDVFLRPKNYQVVRDKGFVAGKGVCFDLGSKVDVEKVELSSGGGGTNTAATFAKQGFKVAYCGRVGDDISGQEIIRELKELGVETQFVLKTKLKPTNHSVILSLPKEDRTILVHRGASEILCERNIPWTKLEAKWFYLAPLSGKLCEITEDLVNFASKKGIKIAFNPGNSQLSLPKDVLKKVLQKVNVLILNQEEASLLTKLPYTQEAKIFKKIDELSPGIAIMTKGSQGIVVSDGKYLWKAKSSKVKVVDGTGAGDSFGSGFVSGFIRSKKMEEIIQLGIANANSCLGQWGAKKGLLGKGDKFPKIKIEKVKL